MSGLPEAWYDGSIWPRLLYPLSLLYRHIVAGRRRRFVDDPDRAWAAPVPVVVVGNITVGGTGKTPLVVWLIEFLRAQGHRPGVISRGYGGRASSWPLSVDSATPVEHCGDEPLMLVRRTGCPLVVAPDRPAAARQLLAQSDCDLILSDDGLQHYALARSVEIVVVDGARGLGNGLCLPAGPLREPVERLMDVDLVVCNGRAEKALPVASMGMELRPGVLQPLAGVQGPAPVSGRVHAVAGIGNPGRFFATLRDMGLEPVCHAFPDHHAYRDTDFGFDDGLAVVMTEKDAVKCGQLNLANAWYLPVDAAPEPGFGERLLACLRAAGSASEKGN